MKRRSFLQLPAALAALFVPLKSRAEKVKPVNEPMQYVGRPTKAITGDFYHDLSSNTVFVYNGSTWLPCTM